MRRHRGASFEAIETVYREVLGGFCTSLRQLLATRRQEPMPFMKPSPARSVAATAFEEKDLLKRGVGCAP